MKYAALVQTHNTVIRDLYWGATPQLVHIHQSVSQLGSRADEHPARGGCGAA